MSFIITLNVREGLVMASDSRLTLNRTDNAPTAAVYLAVGMSDSHYKTFLTPNRIGISFFGDAAIQGVPIAGYLETFIDEYAQNVSVDDLPAKLASYFLGLDPKLKTGFHIAGYTEINGKPEPRVYRVALPTGEVTLGQNSVYWDGETDILLRVITPMWTHDTRGNWQEMPFLQIPFNFFTLQDAIDFAVYAVRTTIETIRFQPRPKTVGGPIDVLVIKPREAYWVQRKTLGVRYC